MDSLDLCRSARLGLNFLENCVDRRRGCLPYFVGSFKYDPAELRHDWPDFGDLTSRYVEAFLLARRMLNMPQPTEVEQALRGLFFSYFSEGDGLSYRPAQEKPYYSTILDRPHNDHVAEMFDQGRVLYALTTWYRLEKDPDILARAKRLLEAMDRRMIKRGNWGCYPKASFEPGYQLPPDASPMPHQIYFAGSQIHALTECYEHMGLDLAMSMAGRLANFARDHADAFEPDGRFICPGGNGFESAELDGHVHSRLATLAGIASLGTLTGQNQWVQWARQSYDWFAAEFCSDFGWSPEFLGRWGVEAEGCETCAIMDQLHCLLALIRGGLGQYWNDFERIVRNQLLEQQLRDTRLFTGAMEKPDTELSCFHDVAAKVLGGFAGWGAPNDFVGNCKHRFWLMNCCGPAGIRSLYLAWENILRVEGSSAEINVLMDRDDAVCRVRNHQPRRGQIDIQPARDLRLKVRVPDWVDPHTVAVAAGGEAAPFEIAAPYVVIPAAKAGRTLTVTYPLRDVVKPTFVNGRHYKVRWVGDTVVGIEPRGRFLPLYDRGHLL